MQHLLKIIAANETTNKLKSNIDFLRDFMGFSEDQTIFDLIFNIFRFAYTLAGILCVGYLIFGGYLYLTSGGDENKAKNGTQAITNAIIGLIIVLAAAAILRTVKYSIGLWVPIIN